MRSLPGMRPLLLGAYVPPASSLVLLLILLLSTQTNGVLGGPSSSPRGLHAATGASSRAAPAAEAAAATDTTVGTALRRSRGRGLQAFVLRRGGATGGGATERSAVVKSGAKADAAKRSERGTTIEVESKSAGSGVSSVISALNSGVLSLLGGSGTVKGVIMGVSAATAATLMLQGKGSKRVASREGSGNVSPEQPSGSNPEASSSSISRSGSGGGVSSSLSSAGRSGSDVVSAISEVLPEVTDEEMNALRGKLRGMVVQRRKEQRQRRKEQRLRRRKAQMKRVNAMPKFPLPTGDSSLISRVWGKRIASMLDTEGGEDEEHVPEERASGAKIARSAIFWKGATTMYLSYKAMQAKCRVQLPRIKDPQERQETEERWWQETHELNSDRMLALCLNLRGFYLKSGQFLGTRSDFMPKAYLKKLSQLHDAVPPMPKEQVEAVIEEELGTPIQDTFSSLNLTHPVGSASISQVHKGVLLSTGQHVAVKVQYPGAEKTMMADLRNIELVATFLQKFELDFDLLSSIKELSKQIHREFDFTVEATTMDRMGPSLEHDCSPLLSVPRSIKATPRLLIMSFVEGQSLASLRRSPTEQHKALRKRIGNKLMHSLADAWGHMLFTEGLFNADVHPGNILIMPADKIGPLGLTLGLLGLKTPELRIGLLDWGQTKELTMEQRTMISTLMLALDSDDAAAIVEGFKGLGITLANPEDDDSIEKLARIMFDTKTIPGLDFNPFSANNVLKLNSVKEYPQDLYFVLRTCLMFRGMSQSLGLEFSLAKEWAPYAQRHLDRCHHDQRRQERHEQQQHRHQQHQ